MPPTLGAALGLSLRALGREAWLVAVGLAVALVRRLAGLPAWIVGGTLVVRGALEEVARRPSPASAVAGALGVVTAPRFLALVAALWIAGALLGAALRVAYVSGALPTLGAAMTERTAGPRFASGVAYRFPAVAATALLGVIAELGADGFALALVLGALRITLQVAGAGGALLAAVVAAALTIAVAVSLAVSVVADAAVARASLGGEGPATAFAGATERFLARPGAFLLLAIGFGIAGALVPATLGVFGSIATGFAGAAHPVLLVGPRLMLSAGVATAVAAMDLWRMGTVAVLAWGARSR